MSYRIGHLSKNPKRPIHVLVRTHERLMARGQMHESFDDVIARSLDQLEAFEQAALTPDMLELRVT